MTDNNDKVNDRQGKEEFDIARKTHVVVLSTVVEECAKSGLKVEMVIAALIGHLMTDVITARMVKGSSEEEIKDFFAKFVDHCLNDSKRMAKAIKADLLSTLKEALEEAEKETEGEEKTEIKFDELKSNGPI